MDYLIKKLKRAKQLHSEAMKRDKDILKQKDFVIAILQKKKVLKKDIKIAIEYIEFWKETHENWIDLIKINKKWKKIGGTVGWQRKWIQIYDKILVKLKEL